MLHPAVIDSLNNFCSLRPFFTLFMDIFSYIIYYFPKNCKHKAEQPQRSSFFMCRYADKRHEKPEARSYSAWASSYAFGYGASGGVHFLPEREILFEDLRHKKGEKPILSFFPMKILFLCSKEQSRKSEYDCTVFLHRIDVF